MSDFRICIIDDDDDVRDSVTALFDSRSIRISNFSTPERFLSIWKTSELREVPAVFIMDIQMPGVSGIETFRHMVEYGLPGHNIVIFLSGNGNLSMAVDMIKEGAFDFIEKPFNGNSFIDRTIQGIEQAQRSHRDSEYSARLETLLSAREQEVARMILEGFVNREIAGRLAISPRTVETHRAKIFEKLNVRNTVEFVRTMVERPRIAAH